MKGVFIIGTLVFVFVVVLGLNYSISGNVVGGPDVSEEGFGGPSAGDSACLYQCVVVEGGVESECMIECGVAPKPVAVDEGESCMQECVARGCDDEYDADCQRANVVVCEDECGMKGDAPDESEMSEEQKCISDCVDAVDSSIRCSAGKAEGEGEQGDEVCQRCAAECVHLYSGHCLTDDLWREKEGECMSQGEHMEAVAVKGDSGQGWECTVDIECVDRSDEFGDEAGEGPGIGDEGYVAPNVVMEVFSNVAGFFKRLFD